MISTHVPWCVCRHLTYTYAHTVWLTPSTSPVLGDPVLSYGLCTSKYRYTYTYTLVGKTLIIFKMHMYVLYEKKKKPRLKVTAPDRPADKRMTEQEEWDLFYDSTFVRMYWPVPVIATLEAEAGGLPRAWGCGSGGRALGLAFAKPCVQSPALRKPGVVACDASTQEVKAKESEV